MQRDPWLAKTRCVHAPGPCMTTAQCLQRSR